MTKLIRISKEFHKKLMMIKLNNEYKSIDATIEALINIKESLENKKNGRT